MPLLSPAEVNSKLSKFPDWRLVDGKTIERSFTLKNFVTVLAFVNKVGELAEAADHHPDILIHNWNKVKISLSSHSAGGLTTKDFNLAWQVDESFCRLYETPLFCCSY
jgi:4a-hydroxytetrahydrobiopterin dehydratase